MHPFLAKLLADKAKKEKKSEVLSNYILAREFAKFRLRVRRIVAAVALLAFGVSAAAFGLLGFLLPNHFVDGGAVGVAMLSAQVSGLDFSVLLVVISIPFIILGYRTIGLQFAIRASIGIVALALAVEFIDIPIITEDKLLVAVFGGFFLGLGTGMTMRAGGVIDGTEIMALQLSKKLGVTVGDVILIINIIIFSIAAWLLSLEIALYSTLTYLAAGRTVDFILEGIEEYTGVTIISPKSEDIRLMITEKLRRGVTIYKGKRGFGSHGHRQAEIDIVYTVITRLEINRLSAEIEQIDPEAFIVMQSVKDTRGGMIKKRAHKH
ncbi:MAG TPA: YitT family protein [Chitinophagales bacterium]|nr:YitT family protein [Chitinophagales bacterium]HMZ88084.1 YitT family protein [Chitinophagales bacterium]HNA57411.1 YitT family protein [Chitinophagales bacterium]HNE45766.1 YitT family protein [Chitinophagales bacterium]HNF68928.1 YitT family protein [Chitinophagales bacterium]